MSDAHMLLSRCFAACLYSKTQKLSTVVLKPFSGMPHFRSLK